jgi:hypothetical protein
LTCHGFRSIHFERFAASLQHIAYPHCPRLKRVAPAEAMMKRELRSHQLDLLMIDKGTIECQRLDQASRSEITNLLRLLLSECVSNATRATEANDE